MNILRLSMMDCEQPRVLNVQFSYRLLLYRIIYWIYSCKRIEEVVSLEIDLYPEHNLSRYAMYHRHVHSISLGNMTCLYEYLILRVQLHNDISLVCAWFFYRKWTISLYFFSELQLVTKGVFSTNYTVLPQIWNTSRVSMMDCGQPGVLIV